MNRVSHIKYIALVSLALMSLSASPAVFGYPPDNAAVLYYKASSLYQIDEPEGEALYKFRKGEIELNDKIRELVEKNREAIIALLDACEVKNCDWGINYARGCELMPPRYATLRQLSALIVAEAKIHARDGEYRTALERCLSLHRMAHHINDRLFISYLVGIAINAMAHDCMAETLADVASDTETLTWLKDQLVQIEDLPLSIDAALEGERQAGDISITVDGIANLLEVGFCDEAFQKLAEEKVNARDEAFFARNRASWNQYWSDAKAAFDLPYPQAFQKLKQLYEAFDKDPNAVFMIAMVPACENIYTLSVRSRTHYNAIMTALDLYLARARTGQLPDALPADAPGDLFSGQPFRYEKTADGFVLHCQGKDQARDKTYEYAFKIKK